MEKINVYLRLDKKDFASVLERASQESIDDDPNNEDAVQDYLFPKAEIRLDDMYVADKSDEIESRGYLFCFGKEVGWIDLTIPFDQEIAKDIIERYIKKLQKLKTILEATKD